MKDESAIILRGIKTISQKKPSQIINDVVKKNMIGIKTISQIKSGQKINNYVKKNTDESQILLHGVKTLSQIKSREKINDYIKKNMGDSLNKLTKLLDEETYNIKYKDNILLYNYIFNIEPDDDKFKNTNINKLNFNIIFFSFLKYYEKINDILINYKNIFFFNKHIIELSDKYILNNKLFYDNHTNNFLIYLIKHYFETLKIILYIDEKNFIYINIYINKNLNIIRKFTYEQLKNNFYKITICLISSNKINVFNYIHYNNILNLYINYFIYKISNNFIIYYEKDILNATHLIESEDMCINKDGIPYRKDGILNAINHFTSTYYSNFINYYIKYKISLDKSSKIKTGGGFFSSYKNVNKNVNKKVVNKKVYNKKNRLIFLKNILYNFNKSKDFINKYDEIKIDESNKIYGLIASFDIIKDVEDEMTVPSLRFIFLNQITKNVEDIDNMYKLQESINNSYIYSKIYINILNKVNQSFVDEIFEIFPLYNIIDNIKFNYNNTVLITSNKMKSYLLNKNKKGRNKKLLKEFIKINKKYYYCIYINLNDNKKISYSYKLNINYNLDGINIKELKYEIKNYVENNIRNLHTNFNTYLENNKYIKILFIILRKEKCSIDIIIANNNTYLLIKKNDKLIIFDAFNIINLFSFSKDFETPFYNIIYDLNFINYYKKIDKDYVFKFDSPKNYFEKLWVIYNTTYCNINNFLKVNNINLLNVYFKDGITSIEPDLLLKSKSLKRELIKLSFDFNIYNRDFYNFFINQKDIELKLIVKNELLYIKIIKRMKESLIELNLFKNLLITADFKIQNIIYMDKIEPTKERCNDTYYSF
jgi:hypothetical protein